MKYIIMVLAIVSNMPLWADTFNFGGCSGSGTFRQQIHEFENYEDAVTVGDIPSGIQGLHVHRFQCAWGN